MCLVDVFCFYCARRVPLGMCAQMCAKFTKCNSVTGAPDFGQI
jgi:threonine synthase